MTADDTVEVWAATILRRSVQEETVEKDTMEEKVDETAEETVERWWTKWRRRRWASTETVEETSRQMKLGALTSVPIV